MGVELQTRISTRTFTQFEFNKYLLSLFSLGVLFSLVHLF